jgi:hypothetical protein
MTLQQQILEATRHRGGLKMQPCLTVDPVWFTAIQAEVNSLLAEKEASDVSAKVHPTNWTNPYGNVTQHSLFNESGKTGDPTTDHNVKIEGKIFAAPEYGSLQRLFSPFQSRSLNFRLNGLMAKSGLSPHEENIIHGEKTRIRLHLPVLTNPRAKVMLDGEQFHLRAGTVYYFNNGCVHSAANEGNEARYHLLWDFFLDEWSEENVFNLNSPASPIEGLRKVTRREAAELSVSEPWHIDQYINYRGEIVKTGAAAAAQSN